MRGLTWVGGGADRFSDELAHVRRNLQQALGEAVESVTARVRQLGGHAPAPPPLQTQVAVAGVRPGSFTGINPARLEHLIADLRRAGEGLTQAGSRLYGELNAICVPAEPGQRVGKTGEWAGTQVTDLTRRLDSIRRTGPNLPFNAAMTGYGLFGDHAPDPANAAKVLGWAQAGNKDAFTELLRIQERGTSPGLAARVNIWWLTLDENTRAALLASNPAGIGRLNGIPSGVRDTANRTVLAQRKDAARQALNDILSRRPEGWKEQAEEQSRILKRIGQVERGLAAGGTNGRPAALLLAFDPGGPVGRAVISYGNPDTAEHVVAYVPGLSTNLDGAAGDFQRAWKLLDRTQPYSKSVASIAWLGYDAPQLSADVLIKGKSVAADDVADRGALILAAFADGLKATHRGDGDSHMTVLGHSYGSLVTGKAAVLRPGSFADRLIFVGSPGVGVGHAAELRIAPKNVWVGEALFDPVADLGRFGEDPGKVEFGARPFPVEPGPLSSAHSSYWDQNSTSLRTMAKIVTNHEDLADFPVHDPSAR
ncbi:alpha/beta hydrolase [Rhizohabitans arisaemae]|uniref:alpha/beta hydrolase n=1 Tax=Rhizohabitans arisaemae TaxID=2720610 RepID=UPI0024B204C7|nr:alpha/beta hydrolase [Rhizohabitans arisaemae]